MTNTEIVGTYTGCSVLLAITPARRLDRSTGVAYESKEALYRIVGAASRGCALKGQFHHFQINVSDLKRSDKFYDGFLGWLGYERVLKVDQTEARDIVGWRCGRSRLFLTQCRDEFLSGGFHRKRIGLNHVAFWVPTRSWVDRFYDEYLVPHKIPVLYGGPKLYNEYRVGYYAVYFEDPDRLKLEVVTAPSFTLSYKGEKRVGLPRH